MTARTNLAREIERLYHNASFGTVEVNKAIDAVVAEAEARGAAEEREKVSAWIAKTKIDYRVIGRAEGAAAVQAQVEAAIDASMVSSEYGEHCVEVPALRAALAADGDQTKEDGR